MVFDIAAVREQYRWSSVASQFADACIARLDAGASAQDVQYRIVRGRAQEDLSWAYGGTPVKMWTYVEPTASAVAVGRKKGSKQRRETSCSSSQRPRQRVVVADGQDALWRSAFNPDTFLLLAEYADSSTFKAAGDTKRTAREKHVWWGQYLEERRSRGMAVSAVLEARLEHYRKTKASPSCGKLKHVTVATRALVLGSRWLIWSPTALRWMKMTARAALRARPVPVAKRRSVSSDGAASEPRDKKVRTEADSDAAEERAIGSDDEMGLVRARGDPAESARALACVGVGRGLGGYAGVSGGYAGGLVRRHQSRAWVTRLSLP